MLFATAHPAVRHALTLRLRALRHHTRTAKLANPSCEQESLVEKPSLKKPTIASPVPPPPVAPVALRPIVNPTLTVCRQLVQAKARVACTNGLNSKATGYLVAVITRTSALAGYLEPLQCENLWVHWRTTTPHQTPPQQLFIILDENTYTYKAFQYLDGSLA